MSKEINPHLKPFVVFIGGWEVESPQYPEAKGKETFEWIEGGAYLLIRSEISQPFPSGTWPVGADDTTKQRSALYFDTRQVSRIYQMDFDGKTWKIWRNAPGFSQRFTGTLDNDKDVITAKWEKSDDESRWKLDFDLVYRRVK